MINPSGVCPHGLASSLGPLLWLLAGGALWAADFYVTPAGDDAGSGTAVNTAWRSLERVNRARFQPGDRILFQANQSFPGHLHLSAEDAGASNAPVIVTSFGAGRATILAGRESGLTFESVGFLVVSNLTIRGAGSTTNTGYGILCDNRLDEFRRLGQLRLEDLEVSGFGVFGILVSGLRAGFEHVRVTRCALHHNLRGGMEIAGRLPYDSPLYAHADVRVSYCDAYENSGDPNYARNHSGSGMVLYQVDGGSMDHCRAWRNGELCRSKSGGGVGLWTCASRRVVLQHCESFENKTGGKDGGGFDLDGGCVECVLQYNYSHDNDGPGLMVYTYAYASYSDRSNIVRFNISENDSRKSRSYAGLWVRNDGQGMTDVEIHNNTVRVGPWTAQAALVRGGGVQARFRNNLLIGSGGAVPLRVEEPDSALRFEQNLYWAESAPLRLEWGPRVFASLAAWREATGQESKEGQAIGCVADPKLPRAPSHAVAPAGLTPANLLTYRPLAHPVAFARGLPCPSAWDGATAPKDLLGNSLSAGTWPLGAISQTAPTD